MGALLCVLDEGGFSRRLELAQRMVEKSSYRGEAEFYQDENILLGIQSNAGDASLTEYGVFVVAVHGFISNWGDLKRTWSHAFSSSSNDADKLAAAYRQLGHGLFEQLRGEFSILIWNRECKRLVAVRDTVGCRPLFMLRQPQVLLASEIRQLRAGAGFEPKPDLSNIVQTMLYYHIDQSRTSFEGVERLLPASFYCVDYDRKASGHYQIHSKPYWQPPETEYCKRDIRSYADELDVILRKIITRAIPDKPYALALSGGLDSATIWCYLAKTMPEKCDKGQAITLSLLYPGLACDESDYIKKILADTPIDHKAILIDTSNEWLSDYIEEISSQVDTLFISSVHSIDVLSKKMKEEKRQTILVGVGGDEWLQGAIDYLNDDFRSGHWLRLWRDLVTTKFRDLDGLARWRRLLRAALRPVGYGATSVQAPIWLNDQYQDVFNQVQRHRALASQGKLKSRVYIDWMLTQIVQAGTGLELMEQRFAYHGCELRSPYMDRDLIEFSFRTPPRALIGGQSLKFLMREAAAGILTPSIASRQQKTNFSSKPQKDSRLLEQLGPVDSWNLVRLGLISDRITAKLRRSAKGSHAYSSVEINLAVYEYGIRGMFGRL
ncbi:MAG: hypothetical protein KZQ58_13120 [gamma proteobacterium symbiont of Bathyaustriella thionipta]|nr:hypothetical protein [gamma proteobacterium symbiont of Bathyaustriella thionipta]